MMNNKLIKDILNIEIQNLTTLYENERRWAFYYQVQFKELKSKKRWQETDRIKYTLLKRDMNESFKRCAKYKSDRKAIQIYLDTTFKSHICRYMKNMVV